jgi:hypothetical protein
VRQHECAKSPSNSFADRHRTAEVSIRVKEGRLWAGSNGVEESADETSKRSAQRNIADLHVRETNRSQPLDLFVCYSGCILADRLGIGEHFDVPLTQAG